MARFGTADQWIGFNARKAAREHNRWLKENMTRGPGLMSRRETEMAHPDNWMSEVVWVSNAETRQREKRRVVFAARAG